MHTRQNTHVLDGSKKKNLRVFSVKSLSVVISFLRFFAVAVLLKMLNVHNLK